MLNLINSSIISNPKTSTFAFDRFYFLTAEWTKAKELAYRHTEKKNFFKMLQRTTKKENKKTVNSSAFRKAGIIFHGGHLVDTDDNSTGHNSTLPKVAVQCFVGQFCGYINFSASYERLC